MKQSIPKLKINHAPKTLWRDPWQFIAFGCGSGASPLVPGTIGSLAAIIPYVLLAQLHAGWYLAIVALVFISGCTICQRVSAQLGVHDHRGIVIDEWVGMWLTLFSFPLNLFWVVCGFVAFRIFDILKPWPIRWVDQRVTNGVGIMLDDVLAALYANLVLQALRLF